MNTGLRLALIKIMWIKIFFIVALIINIQTRADFSFEESMSCVQRVEQEYAQSSEHLIQAYELAKIIPYEFENSRSRLIENRRDGLYECTLLLSAQETVDRGNSDGVVLNLQSPRALASIDHHSEDLIGSHPESYSNKEEGYTPTDTIFEGNSEILTPLTEDEDRVRVGF